MPQTLLLVDIVVAIAAYSAAWLVIIFGSGYVAHRMSGQVLEVLPVVTRTYHWELSGKIYERLWIRAWKDRFPEAGDFYEGGISKRSLPGRTREGLAIFRREAVRAEFSHWLTWTLVLTFFSWTPLYIASGMMVLGTAINLPPILIQRYNRARIHRISARRCMRFSTIGCGVIERP